MTDCIIIGSGIAGISAALTLKANGKSFLLFGSPALSEKIEKAELIRNYPGLSNVTGKAFVDVLKAQLVEAEILGIHTVALAQGICHAVAGKGVIVAIVVTLVEVGMGQFLCQAAEDISTIHSLTHQDFLCGRIIDSANTIGNLFADLQSAGRMAAQGF